MNQSDLTLLSTAYLPTLNFNPKLKQKKKQQQKKQAFSWRSRATIVWYS